MRALLLLTLPGVSCLALPAQAQQACPPLARAFQLALERGPGSTYSMPISVNGKEKRFLVATGNFTSMLGRNAVTDLNLTPKPFGQRLSRNGTTAGDAQVVLTDLQIGPVKATGHELWVGGGGAYDGVVGADLMQNYDIEFDFAGGTLSYFLTDHCPGRVVHWATTGVTSVDFVGWDNHANTQAILQVKVQINGRAVTAGLNTGQTRTTLDADTARSLFQVTADSPGAVAMGALDSNPSHRVYGYTFETLKIGGLTIRNPEVQVVPDLFGTKDRNMLTADSHIRTVVDNSFPTMTIGMDILSRLHLYLAAKEKKIYFTAAAGQAVTAPQPAAKPAN